MAVYCANKKRFEISKADSEVKPVAEFAFPALALLDIQS
jgi:hypothetical protein